ncbi:MAG: 30S ribosomal protein S6 [Parvibaculaceae bacterium]|nr:30S ribosomal protein S6 [Parvibaculaceae bacterium]
MSLYEHIFIARQDISAQQVETLVEQFTAVITEAEGKVTKNEYWGLRNLAYKVKKNRKGHYGLLNIDAPHAAVAEMERLMSLNEDILRFMTIRVDELEEGPSAVMQNKGSRDGRRGDRGPRPPRSDSPRTPRSEPAKAEAAPSASTEE